MQDTAPIEPIDDTIVYELMGSRVAVTSVLTPEQIGAIRTDGGVVPVRSADTGAEWCVSAYRIVPPGW
ncbi:hypothetical protein [Agromyces humi]|uniref:hypothetical protein n=1 Tax=Agromyces humi TaxID=1766800 RepID=UPI00135C1E22|nr:hypothetical protein [Agromyces humi]